MRSSPIAFIGSNGQAPVSFAGSFPVSNGATDSPVGSSGLSGIIDTNAAANEVLETAINGTAVGITAFAAEAGHTVEYTLSVNPGGLFAIELSTGEVTKAAALDAETALSHDITVRATSSSGKIKERVFSIAVNDANEFAVGAVTDVNAAANEVSESAANGTAVGITAQATDADVSDTVTFSLTDDAGGRFAIDTDTGVVTVADTGLIDFETQTSHDITVRATSTDASTQDQNFTITVLNDVADDGLVPATRFEGTSTVLRRAANPTGAADGVNGTFAIPIKMMGAADPFDTKLQYIWSNETGSYIRRNADGKVEALFADSAGVERSKIISTNELEVGDGWVMLLVNPDKMYFGNTDETGTRTTGAAADIDWTSGFNWGEDSAGGNRGNFELARPWLALEAYDLTVQANREAFFNAPAPLDLADIKTDGSGPTGTQALDLLPNAYTAVSQNAGSGGNYSAVGTPREGTGPNGDALTAPASLTLQGATFDGTTDYLNKSGAGMGAASNDMMVSFWARRTRIGVLEVIHSSQATDRWTAEFRSSDDLFQCHWADNSAIDRIRLRSTTPIVDTGWHHYMFAFHNGTSTGGAATGELYIDGVDETNIITNTIGVDQFEPQGRTHAIGGLGTSGTSLFRGDLAQMWVDDGNYDLTLLATRQLFYDGGPVDFGTDGANPGTTPFLYLLFEPGSLLVNSGSAGDLTDNGSIVNSPTSPTD